MAEALLELHGDDGSGHCSVCSAGGQSGRFVWPCRTVAAARTAALPGTPLGAASGDRNQLPDAGGLTGARRDRDNRRSWARASWSVAARRSRTSPPADSGLSHWSSREMAAFIGRTEGVSVSHHYVAKLWREAGLRPHRQGTFKLSRDPAFAEKVADIVGLYLDPPAAAVVLSIDEKTQIQALDRTQPLLPIEFDVSEKRTHDYVRHGTTNLFAALEVGTGQVFGECKPSRDGANFLAFLIKAVRRHPGREVHVVLDNLSTHSTPDVLKWLEGNPHVHFHFTPIGSSWINQTWFGIVARQSIRPGTFTSVTVLIKQIRDYIEHWNTDPKPFEWIATADEILARAQLVQSSIKQLVDKPGGVV
jgi:transposase